MSAAAAIETVTQAQPANAAEPAKAAAAEVKPDKPEAEKPKPKTPANPAEARDSLIAKHAKAMNAQAEKDGVEVNAPPEERRAKPGPKPGSKRPAPSPKAGEDAAAQDKPEPATQPASLKAASAPEASGEPEADDGDDDADDGKPEPRATHQLKVKSRLRHGDVDKAIRQAFGDLRPEEFDSVKEALGKKLGVSSKQWADFRRHTAAETAKVREFEQRAIGLSQKLQEDFGGMLEARKAYKAGDYTTAFAKAFPGEDISTLTRKAMHQHLSQDPEKVRLQQRIDALEAKITQPAQPSPEQQAAHADQAVQRELQRTHEALTSQTDDPEVAHFARRKSYLQRVVEIRSEHYDPQSRTTISLRDAADMARSELKRAMDEWRYEPGSGGPAQNSASPGLAGNEPVRSSPGARSPNPSLAASAGGSTRNLTREERIKAFAQRMG